MNHKVTFLPHIEKEFQNKYAQIEQLMKNKHYNEALQCIDFLWEKNYKIKLLSIQKLHCLHQLNRWSEVEELSELCIRYSSNNDEQDRYFLYYVQSLFQQNEYELVVEIIDEKRNERDLSKSVLASISDLYEKSVNMIHEQATSIDHQLQKAIVSEDEQQQWHLIHQRNKLNTPPTDLTFYMLELDSVNHFVKTSIIHLLLKSNSNEKVTIVKDKNRQQTIINQLLPIDKHPIYRKTLKQLTKLEQKNPTLYELTNELLLRYIEYIYPFLYDEKDVPIVSEVVMILAQSHLEGISEHNLKESKELLHYQKEIERANEAYFRLLIN